MFIPDMYSELCPILSYGFSFSNIKTFLLLQELHSRQEMLNTINISGLTAKTVATIDKEMFGQVREEAR